MVAKAQNLDRFCNESAIDLKLTLLLPPLFGLHDLDCFMSQKITTACPHCRVKLAVSENAIGQTRNCPKCGNGFTIAASPIESPPVVRPIPDSSPGMSPLDPVAPLPKASFQDQLAKQRGQGPKRGLTRREKLQRARNRDAGDSNEFDWHMAGWGVALVILGFVSVGMPDAESIRGGRGVVKLLGKALFMLGPFAPLLGLLLGLGGVGLIATSAKNLPKAAVIVGGSVLSLMLVLACGASFLNASGMFDSAVQSANNKKRAAENEAAQKENEKLFNERKQAFEAALLAGANQSRQPAEDPITSQPAERTPFAANDLSESGAPANDDEINPFAAAENNSGASDSSEVNPFENPANTDVPSSAPDQPDNPFASMDNGFPGEGQMKQEMAKNDLRFECARRFGKGDSLIRFKRQGFGNNPSNLKMGSFTGIESNQGKVFYSETPINGVTFFPDTVSYLLPSWTEGSSAYTTTVNPGEAIYGLNLNIDNNLLVGIQAVFAPIIDGQMDKSNLSTGTWLGTEPDKDRSTTLDGGGKNIHGFLLTQKGFDIVGIQLIVEK